LLWFINLKRSLEEVHRIGIYHIFPDKNGSPKLRCPDSHEVSQPSQYACCKKQANYCTDRLMNLETDEHKETKLIIGFLHSEMPYSLPKKPQVSEEISVGSRH